MTGWGRWALPAEEFFGDDDDIAALELDIGAPAFLDFFDVDGEFQF